MGAELAKGLDITTGAWGRSAFERELARAVSEVKKSQVSLTLLYVDVDDFLEHQDLQGEPRTDELLGWVAQRIAEVVNGRGPLGRVDDDAFGVFVKGASLAEATRMSEAIRMRVGTTRHVGNAGPFRVTVSVGVAALRKSEPWGNLLEAAENACLKAKQGGRDRSAGR